MNNKDSIKISVIIYRHIMKPSRSTKQQQKDNTQLSGSLYLKQLCNVSVGHNLMGKKMVLFETSTFVGQ